MITYRKDSLFDSGATAIVNAVNCVGVMGGGLALAFKEKYPLMFLDYKHYCDNGQLRPGKLHTYQPTLTNDPCIVNLPTKDHWENPSKLEYIESGMARLSVRAVVNSWHSVAVPALGCGLGGLEWDDVKPIIEKHARLSPNTLWIVYPPQGNTK